MRRRISLILGLGGYLFPALWLWWQYEQAPAGPGCGLWVLFAYFWGAVLAVLLSGTSTCLGVLAWRNFVEPRPLARVIEIAVYTLPGVVGLAIIGLIFCV